MFPGIAVAERLKEIDSEIDVFWIGSKKGMEQEIVSRYGIPFYSIPAGKLRRYFSLLNFIDIFKIAGGFITSLFLLKQLKAEMLFSKGGFVSVPPAVAACVLGIPVITHDSDLDPGLATRINAKFARRILVPYKESVKKFKNTERVLITGNPIRREILNGDPLTGRGLFSISDNKKILLILGGSQGAMQINNLIASIIDRLVPEVFVVHQTGILNFKESERYGYVTVPFLTDSLSDILAAADLVVSRAGAGTLWENGAAGKASILIPLGSGSSRGDQKRNAEYFVKNKAAVMLDGDITGDELYSRITELLNDDKKRKKMGSAAEELCNKDAADRIASIIKKEF